MKQKIILLVYVAMTFISLILSSIFGSYYETEKEDLTSITGTIEGELKVLKDEYGKDVGLRFHLKDQAVTYSLAGKLLRLSDPDIYALKEGDQVQVWHRKESSKTFVDNFMDHLDGVWGINQVNGKPLLAIETSLKQRKSLQSLVLMSFFVIFAGCFSFLIYRQLKRMD